MKHFVDVNADAFRIVSAFVSHESTRYYLNGVYVHAHPCGGAVLVATDGHRLIAYYDRTGQCDAAGHILAPGKATIRATKRTKDEKPSRRGGGINSLRLRWNGERADIATEAGDIRASEALSEIDGTFLDYQRVIPHRLTGATKGPPPSFSVDDISDFAAAARDLIDSGLSNLANPCMAISTDGAGPVLVHLNDDENVCAVFMPFGRTVVDPAPPEFITALLGRK